MKAATTPGVLIENEFDDVVVSIFSLIVDNTGSEDSEVSIKITRSGDSFCLFDRCVIPYGKSVNVFVNKDFGVYLEPGDGLTVSSSKSGVDVACSYAEISQD